MLSRTEKRLFKSSALLLALLLGLVAGGDWAAASPAESTNVELIIDASGSMAGEMEGRTKMAIAKDVLLDLLAGLPSGAQVAVSAYGHRQEKDCNDIELLAALGPNDPSRMADKVRALQPVGMTPIAAALEAAGRNLEGQAGRNVVILVSDGKETCQGDPCAVARNLRESGMQMEVNVIGFDVTAEERKQLECIAENSGGRYYQAGNAAEFEMAAAEVGQQVAGEVFFRDDFDGKELNKAWTIVNEDPNRWVQERGALMIVTQSGNIIGEREDLKNQFVLDRELPEDYVVTVKLDVTLRSQGNWASLLLHRDNDYYLRVAYWGRPWGNNVYRRPIFTKEIGGEVNHLEFGPRQVEMGEGQPALDFMGPRQDPETIWLRLEKRGSRFTGLFSMNGEEWHKIGDHTMLRMGEARLSLGASNLQDGGAEVAAQFDYVEIRPLE